MRFSILAAIAALSVAPSAHAEQWWFIGLSESNANVIETDTIVELPLGERRIWMSILYPTPLADVPAKDVAVLRTLYEVDCKQGRSRSLQGTFLTKELVSRWQSPATPSAWSYAAPGTTASSMIEAACHGIDAVSKLGPEKSLSDALDFYFWWVRELETKK
jgi:hypothetical protein